MLVPLHGIASRHDLPLPFSFVVVGAALALDHLLRGAAVAWRQPRFTEVGGRALPGLTRVDRPSRRTGSRLGCWCWPPTPGRAWPWWPARTC